VNNKYNQKHNVKYLNLNNDRIERYLNPDSISLPSGYRIEVFAQGLDSPISMQFASDQSIYIAESGFTSDNPKILRLLGGNFELVADGFNQNISGITIRDSDIYVSHRGFISVIDAAGARKDIISGLPSFGDYSNSRVAFGADHKLYFGQGTTTNSGVVGDDNLWLVNRPFLHDYPGSYIMLRGQNFETQNRFVEAEEVTYTGAFSPYGIPNMPYEVKKGVTKASGSILRANSDGSQLELVAWGLRHPFYVKFDESNRLFSVNRGFDVRGSRPIANVPDDFYQIVPGEWYGWPDFTGGEPVTLDRFRMDGGPQPEFLLLNHPGIPPRPYTIFPAHSSISGFDFNYNSDFGPYGDVYIAEYGTLGRATIGGTSPQYAGIGHRVSRIDMNTGGVTTFAINRSGFSTSITNEGGFSRPIDVTFGPDGALYVLDVGVNAIDNPNYYYPYTGVIWRIERTLA
jgi:glucose/arabinose dehydrogenase